MGAAIQSDLDGGVPMGTIAIPAPRDFFFSFDLGKSVRSSGEIGIVRYRKSDEKPAGAGWQYGLFENDGPNDRR